jgi:proline dehydrogenase
MGIWQTAMVGLARSPGLKRVMQGWAPASALSGRFVGGQSLEEAVATARDLDANQGIAVSLFYLGEYVEDRATIEQTVAAKIAAVEALAEAGLDVHVSVDPSQIGYEVDRHLGQVHAFAIGAAMREVEPAPGRLALMMLDMEDAGYVQPTLDLRAALAAEGVPAAVTLQAYLHRTRDDLQALLEQGAAVRLVKGAFPIDKAIGFPDQAAIRQSFLDLAAMMLSDEARERGVYPIFATHNRKLIDGVLALVKARGWPQGSYEFELLHGVRPPLQRELAAQGEKVRVYLPFGRDWWPYAARRVGENPRNGWLLARALVSRG